MPGLCRKFCRQKEEQIEQHDGKDKPRVGKRCVSIDQISKGQERIVTRQKGLESEPTEHGQKKRRQEFSHAMEEKTVKIACAFPAKRDHQSVARDEEKHSHDHRSPLLKTVDDAQLLRSKHIRDVVNDDEQCENGAKRKCALDIEVVHDKSFPPPKGDDHKDEKQKKREQKQFHAEADVGLWSARYRMQTVPIGWLFRIQKTQVSLMEGFMI